MKLNFFNLFIYSCLISFFLIIAFGSGSDDKKEVFKKNSKEAFCGKEFKSSSYIKEIDMNEDFVTILNCDGTYTSKQDWGTSKSNEETYNNTVGHSSGSFYNFSGTWEIVESESNLPYEVVDNIKDYKGIEYTLIRYNSNKGKTRYALIFDYNDLAKLKDVPSSSNSLTLSVVALSEDCYEYKTYRNEDLHMFGGYAY
jgi:hypothetical protein